MEKIQQVMQTVRKLDTDVVVAVGIKRDYYLFNV